MAIMKNRDLASQQRDEYIESMKGDSGEAIARRDRWYQNERYLRGHMAFDEASAYEIFCGMEDMAEVGFTFSEAQYHEVVNRTLNWIRTGYTAQAVVDGLVDIFGGVPVTLYKTVDRIYNVWHGRH